MFVVRVPGQFADQQLRAGGLRGTPVFDDLTQHGDHVTSIGAGARGRTWEASNSA